MKIKIVFIIIGILLFMWGMTSSNSVGAWDDNIKIESGKLKVMEGAYDPDFDISVDSPLLIREFSTYKTVTFDEDEFDEEELDENGNHLQRKFEKWITEDIDFYGKIMLEGKDLYLSDDLIGRLNPSKNINLYNTLDMLTLELDEDEMENLGFHLEDSDNQIYSTVEGDEQIGDERVRFFVLDPDVFNEEYTVVGAIDGDVIGSEYNNYNFDNNLYNEVYTPEELKDKMGKSDTKASIILKIVGSIITGISIFSIVKK